MIPNLYIGVMSGTSLDGVDVCLCKIDENSCTLLYSLEYPFDLTIKEEILYLLSSKTTLEQIGILHTRLGYLFADAVKVFLKGNKLDPSNIKAIGLHGQTLWHQPFGNFPFSMQLGCPNILVAQTNIQVITDFRSMDIANGGQGAPFAPAFHQFIFSSFKENIAVLNIGGMTNITLLGDSLKGWDIGVGNALLDYWVSTCKNTPYDKDGNFAFSGTLNEELLEKFLSDPYFKKLPPKSTGREYFSTTWLINHLCSFQSIKDEDIQRTLLELTVKSILKILDTTDINLLIVCGGGTKNKFLMKRLKELSQVDIKISDELGISSDFMESMAFAWLAYMRIQAKEVNLSCVTGAKKNSILGGIYG